MEKLSKKFKYLLIENSYYNGGIMPIALTKKTLTKEDRRNINYYNRHIYRNQGIVSRKDISACLFYYKNEVYDIRYLADEEKEFLVKEKVLV